MNGIHALIMGIVEGLTEFLPISSTFHLIVTAKLLSLPSTEFVKMFEVVIQSGAIAALAIMYTQTLLKDRRLLMLVIASFIPTAIIGLALQKVIKNVFFETNWLMLAVFIGMGIVFIVVERLIKKNKYELTKSCESLTLAQAILIGLAQACSIIPGVSRAGSILVPMIIMGYKRSEAAKYTFLLSLPTIFAASALDLYKGRALLMTGGANWLALGIGFITSMIVAYLVVKWLIRYLGTHTLEIFGWYRLLVAGLLIFFKVLV
jgi:undecaprenyl-diphosphatase